MNCVGKRVWQSDDTGEFGDNPAKGNNLDAMEMLKPVALAGVQKIFGHPHLRKNCFHQSLLPGPDKHVPLPRARTYRSTAPGPLLEGERGLTSLHGDIKILTFDRSPSKLLRRPVHSFDAMMCRTSARLPIARPVCETLCETL